MPDSTLVAKTITGHRYVLTPGVVCAKARTVFTRGHCARLALAIHERTGWDLKVFIVNANRRASLGDAPDVRRAADHGEPIPTSYLRDLWGHVMVERPDGTLLDVLGPQDVDTAHAIWNSPLHVDPKEAVHPFAMSKYRWRLVPALPAEVASLHTTAPHLPGLAEAFADAVLDLEPAAPLPFPWERDLRSFVRAGLRKARSSGRDAAVEELLVTLEEDHHLLVEAIRRDLIPAGCRETAQRIARGESRLVLSQPAV